MCFNLALFSLQDSCNPNAYHIFLRQDWRFLVMSNCENPNSYYLVKNQFRKWSFHSFGTDIFQFRNCFSSFSALVMASEEASIDTAEKKWQAYEISRISLEMKSKQELRFLLSEKKKSMGESGFVPESLTKQDILDMILVPVMKPVGCDGLLSYQRASSSSSSDSQGSHTSMPTKLTCEDFVHPDGKTFSSKDLDVLLSERGLSKVGNKAQKRKRLLEYDPVKFRETRKKRRIEIYKERPNHPCILQQLWDLVEGEVKKFNLERNVVAAGELATLCPHILQHMDNSVSFHIHKVSTVYL
jgi:hypothetical protein